MKLENLLAGLLFWIGIVWVAAWLSACGGVIASPQPWREGWITLSADEKGMRAYGDTMVGIANEARTPTGMKSSHYQLRDAQEQEETKRAYAPGFLSKLFGGGANGN